MGIRKFRIAVTGDTGFDIYTEYVRGYEDPITRLRAPEAAYDVQVPSGSAFTVEVFRQLIGGNTGSEIEIVRHFPKHSRSGGGKGDFITLHKSLVELRRFSSDLGSKCRVAHARPIRDKDLIKDPDVFDKLICDRKGSVNAQNIDLLVIHDGAGTWRKYPEKATDRHGAMRLVASLLETSSSPGQSFWPKVLVNLCHDLPDVERKSNNDLQFRPELTFWHKLYTHKKRVCVVCSAGILRREGAAISRRLSWEQTIEDLAFDLTHFDKLQLLSEFGHLIIRFGVAGAVHIRADETGHHEADLIFAPHVKGGIYRDPLEDGEIIDENVFLVAALTQMMATKRSEADSSFAFVNAIKTGLSTCIQAFDRGYHIDWKKDTEGDGLTTLGTDVIVRLCDGLQTPFRKGYADNQKSRAQTLGHTRILDDVIGDHSRAASNRKSDWEILRRSIQSFSRTYHRDPQLADRLRINVGMAIVLLGTDRVLNCELTELEERAKQLLRRSIFVPPANALSDHQTLGDGELPELPSDSTETLEPEEQIAPIYAPLMTFGKLMVAERKEIEGLRSLHNLIKNYSQQCSGGSLLPPFSIAVFGPPGSGKSFAVKQLAEDINTGLQEEHIALEPIEYNISQFRTIDDLGNAIGRASSVVNEGRVPLVFFDEFDCEFEGKPLGWLKYFLAPMQDGTFYGVRQTIRIAKAIFVFAGSIYGSFGEFDPSMIARETEGAQTRLDIFRSLKGPDFVSRLRGHVDILPISGKDRGDIKPIVRRAIILRYFLEARKLTSNIRDINEATIDEDIVYALLTVDKYRHGTRSVEAVLQMCTPINGKIEKASLPSRVQLNMHVDAEAFFIRMHRGRFLRSRICQEQKETHRKRAQTGQHTREDTLSRVSRNAGRPPVPSPAPRI